MARFVMDVTDDGATFVEVDEQNRAPVSPRPEEASPLTSGAVTPSACAGGTAHKGKNPRPAPLQKAPPRKRVWQPSFQAEMDRLRALTPGWGGLDCVTLVRDMVVALTGADPALWPSGWSDEATARKAMARCGCRDVGEVLAAILAEIPPAFARMGDVGTIAGPDGPAGCIVLGETLAVVRADGLTLTTPRRLLLRAFRV